MTTAKKRSSYSFSLKKTDNPIIKEFIEKQDNFSETMRYLIIKYCMENGIENVSSKLNDLIYNLAYSNKNTTELNQIKNNEEEPIKKIETNNAKDEISADLQNDNKDDKNDKDDVPECYK